MNIKDRKGHWEGRCWISDKSYEPEWMTRKYPKRLNPNFDPNSVSLWDNTKKKKTKQ